jgi:hypothetical protein
MPSASSAIAAFASGLSKGDVIAAPKNYGGAREEIGARTPPLVGLAAKDSNSTKPRRGGATTRSEKSHRRFV